MIAQRRILPMALLRAFVRGAVQACRTAHRRSNDRNPEWCCDMNGFLRPADTFLALAVLVAWIYSLVACIRRDTEGFPHVVYGGKPLTQRAVKRSWIGLLVLCLLTGFSVSEVSSRSTTYALESDAAQRILNEKGFESTSLASSFSARGGTFLRYEISLEDGAMEYSTSTHIPWILVLGLFLFYRLVIRWPERVSSVPGGPVEGTLPVQPPPRTSIVEPEDDG